MIMGKKNKCMFLSLFFMSQVLDFLGRAASQRKCGHRLGRVPSIPAPAATPTFVFLHVIVSG